MSEELINNPNANYAVIRIAAKVRNRNLKQPEDFKLKICKEAFTMAPIVIYTQRNSIFVEEINEMLDLFKSAGLVMHWHDKFVDKDMKTVNNEPKALEFSHIKASLILLAIGYALSFASFLTEKLKFCSRPTIRDFTP
jgi:hypothetical protein